MNDQELLARFIASRDGNAFAELVQRHAVWVRAACFRILNNSHEAEELAQECFLELAQQSENVHTSVAGWLHRAATTRSLNAVRQRRRRNVRERAVGMTVEATSVNVDVTTPELRQIIDGTLNELPDDLRVPIMLHYFDGRSQRDVASQLGVNQSTISRRMRDALQHLRERLTQAGYAAMLPAMFVLTREKVVNAASNATPSKSGLSNTACKLAGTSPLIAVLKSFSTVCISILTYCLFGGWISLFVGVGLTAFVAKYRPLWVQDLYASLGVPDLYSEPTYSFAKWNWTSPPKGWLVRSIASFVWSISFLCLSIAIGCAVEDVPWGTFFFAVLVGIGFGLHGMRILYRVYFHCRRAGSRSNEIPKLEFVEEWKTVLEQLGCVSAKIDKLSWFEATQLIGIGFFSAVISGQLLLHVGWISVWPVAICTGFVGIGLLVPGLYLSQKLSRSIRKQMNVTDNCILPTNSTIGSRSPTATLLVLATGVSVVVGISACVFVNPTGARGLPLSLAALQTTILGWMFYRLAVHCRQFALHAVCRVAIILLVCCFVLNSGVCLANWLR